MSDTRPFRQLYREYLAGRAKFEDVDRASEEFLTEYQRAKQQAADSFLPSDERAKQSS